MLPMSLVCFVLKYCICSRTYRGLRLNNNNVTLLLLRRVAALRGILVSHHTIYMETRRL